MRGCVAELSGHGRERKERRWEMSAGAQQEGSGLYAEHTGSHEG